MCQGTPGPGTGPRRIPGGETATAIGLQAHGVSGSEAGAGTAAAAETSADAAEEVTGGGEEAEFRIAEETLYHGARRDFFLGAHRWAMFLAIIFGASAATAFGGERVCGLLAAIAASADIAFDFVGRAQAHADVRRRYLELGSAIESGRTPREDFRVEWMKISADEPPLYRWVAEIAHRNACIALGKVADEPLSLGKRMLAHIWRG